MKLLEINNLKIFFDTPEGTVKAINDVNLNLLNNESLAIVGESGSGKTQLVFSILGLLAKNATATGSIKYESQEILNLPEEKINNIRTNKISIIFQDPMTSLNPYMRICNQMNEVIIHHKGLNKKDATIQSIRMLDAVKIPDAKNKINMFPHEFSGGMRQRVMIAMSLLCNPNIIIADEPTTSLDVTVQAQIMELFKDIQKEFRTSFILITHNMGIVADTCLKTLVLYGGKVMEYGLTTDIFLNPSHPYTIGLLETMPRIDREYEILKTIPGNPPNMMKLPNGCPFSSRCSYKVNDCLEIQPPIKTINNQNHQRACHVSLAELRL
jgi:oligopeptide transport system ATP-binding protein